MKQNREDDSQVRPKDAEQQEIFGGGFVSKVSMSKCHLCDGELFLINNFARLLQVTADCRPWRRGGHLAVCKRCGTVQKPVSENWLYEVEQIYSGYDLHGQGVEQPIFDKDTGESTPRFLKIIDWLKTHHKLPDSGKLLDIGCGNGAFLRAFGAAYSGWQMTGTELDNHNQAVVESIPGVESLHVGSIETLGEHFDLIVLIHALEHIPNPIQILRQIGKRLNHGGVMFIGLPDLETSPFDILIADHCTHFTADILKEIVVSAGFKILALESDFLPKDLSMMAHLSNNDGRKSGLLVDLKIKERSLGNGKKIVMSHIAFLHDLLQLGQRVKGPLGVFGTAISGTWIAQSLGEKVSFFVDEDVTRVGQTYFSRPIYDPAHAPNGLPIMVPLRADIAASIAKRLKHLDCQFILPPPHK